MANSIGVLCNRCKKGKKKSEIAHIDFADRTITGRIFERKIIRICRDCFKKELDAPIPSDKK